MKRVIDKTRHDGETIEQYNKRIEAETAAYKTTVAYKLWDMSNTMRNLRCWAKDENTRAWCDDVITRLNCLSCQDFGENPDGTLCGKDGGC